MSQTNSNPLEFDPDPTYFPETERGVNEKELMAKTEREKKSLRMPTIRAKATR